MKIRTKKKKKKNKIPKDVFDYLKKNCLFSPFIVTHTFMFFTSSIIINFRESRLPIHLNQTNHQIQHIQL